MITEPNPSRPRPARPRSGLHRPERNRSVRIGALAVATLVATVLSAVGWAGAGTAGASEFNPAPAATATAACSATKFGTSVTVTMTNTAGLAPAHFTVDSFAYGSTAHEVAPGGSEVFVIDSVPESLHLELTVTADYGVVLTKSFDTDCYGYTGQLVPRCDGADAFLDLHVERTGQLAGNVYVDVDGQTVDAMWVDDTWDRSLAVPTGVPLDVVVGNNHDGLIAKHTAAVDCAVPSTTVPSTTVPQTTVPSTTVPQTTSTEPPVVLGATIVAPFVPQRVAAVRTASIVDDDAADELAFTGTETSLLAAIGVLLLAAGVTSHTANRRLRRRTAA